MSSASRTLSAIVVCAALYVAAAWLIKDRYYQLMFTLIPIWAMVGANVTPQLTLPWYMNGWTSFQGILDLRTVWWFAVLVALAAQESSAAHQPVDVRALRDRVFGLVSVPAPMR